MALHVAKPVSRHVCFHHMADQPVGAILFFTKIVLGIELTIAFCQFGDQGHLHAFINTWSVMHHKHACGYFIFIERLNKTRSPDLTCNPSTIIVTLSPLFFPHLLGNDRCIISLSRKGTIKLLDSSKCSIWSPSTTYVDLLDHTHVTSL